ncbi:hypothetical protein Tsubulata_030336 [Turnera subulata]|uniref:Uncharacterized protein n=1 Tax=Turnera subulata TaxID=218843 RepID=A0A9Q0GAW9_9ROSI|nr:hypothetical protein Tsubulata_030336 [Turnera subulata]
MSGLVDMWTSELTKLRSKSEASGSSSDSTSTTTKVVQAEEVSAGSWTKSLPTFVRSMRMNPPPLRYSEASLSMLVECFSP